MKIQDRFVRAWHRYPAALTLLAGALVLALIYGKMSRYKGHQTTQTQSVLRAAQTAKQRGYLDSAKTLADSAWQLGGRREIAESLLGSLTNLRGDPAAAEAHFRQALQRNFDDAEAYAGLAEIAVLRAGQFLRANRSDSALFWAEEARARAERALARNSSLTSALFQRANSLFFLGSLNVESSSNLTQAQQIYTSIKDRPELFDLLSLEAYIQWQDNLAGLQESNINRGPIDFSFSQKAGLGRETRLRLRSENLVGAAEMIEGRFALAQRDTNLAADWFARALNKNPRLAPHIDTFNAHARQNRAWQGNTKTALDYEPQFRFNAHRTGVLAGRGLVWPKIKWRVRVGKVGRISPIVYGNRIIQVAPELQGIAFVNRATGRIDTVIAKPQGFSQSTPAINNGRLWLDAPVSEMFVLQMSSLRILHDVRLLYYQPILDSSPLIAPNGRMLFATRNGQFRSTAVGERGSGNWVWSSNLGSISAPPVAGDSLAMFGSHDGRFYAVNYRKPNTRFDLLDSWVYNSDDTITASASFAKGVVYFGDHGGDFHAFSEKHNIAQPGTPPVQRPLVRYQKINSAILSSPAVDDSLVYFGAQNGKLYALPTFDLKNRQTEDDGPNGRWKEKFIYSAAGAIVSSPCITGGVLYVGTDAGEILALDLVSADKLGAERLLWRLVLAGPVQSSPVVQNGVLYVAADDGYLYAIGN